MVDDHVMLLKLIGLCSYDIYKAEIEHNFKKVETLKNRLEELNDRLVELDLTTCNYEYSN